MTVYKTDDGFIYDDVTGSVCEYAPGPRNDTTTYHRLALLPDTETRMWFQSLQKGDRLWRLDVITKTWQPVKVRGRENGRVWLDLGDGTVTTATIDRVRPD